MFEDTTVFSENDVKEFMGYMRYAKSLFLCSEVILSRAAGNNSEKWQIWVFDELQSLAEQEVKIRKAFGKYAAAVTGKNVSDDVKGVKGLASVKGIDEYCNLDNPKFDEGIAYIVKWLGFMERLLSNVHEAATIALGKARMNLIFIFQTTSWLKSDTSSGMPYTTIAKILNGLNCTKIVGRNAIENDSGVYGNGNVASSKWYKTVCIDGAMNWAISPVDRLGSTSNEDGTGGNVTLFKPFNLWTEPLKPDKTLDLGASSDPNEKRKYFAGYVEELLGNFGLSAADIINDAFQFANQAVVNLGLVSDSRSNLQPVFNYLYDPFDMTGRDNSFTLEGMRALEAKNDAQLAELDAEDNKQAGVTKGVDLSNIAVDGVEDSLTSAGVPINESELLAKPSQAISSQIPNFMSATKLFYAVSHANLTDEVIIGYVSKYLKPYVDAIDEDKYDIFRRDTDSNKISLWSLNHLVRVVGSMHVLLSLRGDMWLQSEIGNHVVSIIKNPSNASSLMLSFLMSQYNNSGNKNLYDRLPSESKVKSCIDFYNNSMMQKVNEQQQSAPYQGEAASDINYEDIYGNGEDASLSDEEAPVTTVQQVQNPIPDFRDFKAEANISNNQTGFDDRMNQAINRNQQQSQVQNNQQVSQSQIVDANGRPIFSNRNPEQQPKQQQINTFSDDVIQRAKVIEVAAANTQPNYQMIAGDDIVFRAIRPTTNCIRIPDASMMVSSSPIMRFRKRLYESKNGTSYALSITWDSVLKKIEYDVNYDRLLVSRFSIGEDGTNTIRVNNTITESLDRVIDAEFGVELGDIVNLHKTFKRFPNISILILGAGSDVALLNEYGADVKEVWKIFQQNQKLKTIIIVKPGSQPVKYDRATFAKDAVGMDKQLKLDQARKELELAMAYKDPDVDKKPMVMHRANTFLTGSAGASFDNGLDALKGDGRGKILRWGLWSILGLGVGFLGVATGIPGEIGLRHKAHKAKRLQKKVSKLENSIKKES